MRYRQVIRKEVDLMTRRCASHDLDCYFHCNLLSLLKVELEQAVSYILLIRGNNLKHVLYNNYHKKGRFVVCNTTFNTKQKQCTSACCEDMFNLKNESFQTWYIQIHIAKSVKNTASPTTE